jgi:hypothetical protein
MKEQCGGKFVLATCNVMSLMSNHDPTGLVSGIVQSWSATNSLAVYNK